MFAALQGSGSQDAACRRVEALVRTQFALLPADEVSVAQVAATLPGCPPLETVITFWTDEADGSTSRHHCKIFKPAHAVGADDLPPRWMKQALRVAPGYGCDCC